MDNCPGTRGLEHGEKCGYDYMVIDSEVCMVCDCVVCDVCIDEALCKLYKNDIIQKGYYIDAQYVRDSDVYHPQYL